VRRLSLALLAVAIVALTAAGLGTAARLGVFQARTAPVGDSGLDPEGRGGGAAGGSPLPSGACPPAPAPGGAEASDFSFAGPCALRETGRAYCNATADDFYVVVQRPLPAGRTLDLYLDVEFYKGPGAYRDAQALLIVQEGTTLYTWSNFRANVTVLPRESGVRLERTDLSPEAGRAGAGVETVSGTLACGGPRPN
jgi:hypothetical protein